MTVVSAVLLILLSTTQAAWAENPFCLGETLKPAPRTTQVLRCVTQDRSGAQVEMRVDLAEGYTLSKRSKVQIKADRKTLSLPVETVDALAIGKRFLVWRVEDGFYSGLHGHIVTSYEVNLDRQTGQGELTIVVTPDRAEAATTSTRSVSCSISPL